METKLVDRKTEIINRLRESNIPISASALAKELSVSRQIIVGDIALLRAKGTQIIATPRGYLLEGAQKNIYTIACVHDQENLLQELYAVVDCGCGLVNVIVEHPIYGEIVGNLHIFSRLDAEDFVRRLEENSVAPLCTITNKLHLHTLACPSEVHLEHVKKKLKELNILVES